MLSACSALCDAKYVALGHTGCSATILVNLDTTKTSDSALGYATAAAATWFAVLDAEACQRRSKLHEKLRGVKLFHTWPGSAAEYIFGINT
jgi:hypothetical protein